MSSLSPRKPAVKEKRAIPAAEKREKAGGGQPAFPGLFVLLSAYGVLEALTGDSDAA